MNAWLEVIRIIDEGHWLSYLTLKFLYDNIGSCLFKCNVITTNMQLYLLSRIYVYENTNMDNVPLRKPHTYASYPLTLNVTDLRLIGCYAYCHCHFMEHQLSCLELACMIFHITFICMLSVTTMSYVMCCSHAHM